MKELCGPLVTTHDIYGKTHRKEQAPARVVRDSALVETPQASAVTETT